MGNHYYDKEGNPRHNARIKEVRDEQLLVSVTTYLGMIDKPGIKFWKENGLITAAYDLVKEGLDYRSLTATDFIRAVNNEFNMNNNAAEIGTAVHAVLEALIREQPRGYAIKEFFLAYADDLAKPLYEVILKAYNWHSNVCTGIGAVEKTVVNIEDRYAGQLDFIGFLRGPNNDNESLGIIDWKTQGLKHPGFSKRDPSKMLKVKINKYDTWPLQMGAYAKIEKARHGYIGVISSNPDFPYFEAIHYTGEQLVTGYKTFKKITELFQILNNL